MATSFVAAFAVRRRVGVFVYLLPLFVMSLIVGWWAGGIKRFCRSNVAASAVCRLHQDHDVSQGGNNSDPVESFQSFQTIVV